MNITPASLCCILLVDKMLLQSLIRYLILASFTSLCAASFIPSSLIERGEVPKALEDIHRYSGNVELHYENSIPKLELKLFTDPEGSKTDSITVKLADKPHERAWTHASNKKSDLLYVWKWSEVTRKLDIYFLLWLNSKKRLGKTPQ